MNPVAKNINKVNRPSTHTDRSKEDRPIQEDLLEVAKAIAANRYSPLYAEDQEEACQLEKS